MSSRSARSRSSAATIRATSRSLSPAAPAPCTPASLARELGIPTVLVPPSPGHRLRGGHARDRHPPRVRRHAPAARWTGSRPRRWTRSSPTSSGEGEARLTRDGVPRQPTGACCAAPTSATTASRSSCRCPCRPARWRPPTWPGCASEFDAMHERAYGYAASEDPVELVNVRLAAVGVTPKPRRAPLPEGGPDAAPAAEGSPGRLVRGGGRLPPDRRARSRQAPARQRRSTGPRSSRSPTPARSCTRAGRPRWTSTPTWCSARCGDAEAPRRARRPRHRHQHRHRLRDRACHLARQRPPGGRHHAQPREGVAAPGRGGGRAASALGRARAATSPGWTRVDARSRATLAAEGPHRRARQQRGDRGRGAARAHPGGRATGRMLRDELLRRDPDDPGGAAVDARAADRVRSSTSRSIAGRCATPNQIAYSASKHALGRGERGAGPRGARLRDPRRDRRAGRRP